jgi:hypothetical protein
MKYSKMVTSALQFCDVDTAKKMINKTLELLENIEN